MKFSGTFRSPSIDLSAYLDRLHSHLTETIQAATREWLHATVTEIPVWSAASVATFLKLAAAVSFPLGASPITGAPNRVALGTSQSVGALTTDKGNQRYTFEYSTTLAHLIYNEFNNANISPDRALFAQLHEPGPYSFQAKGADAFDRAAGQVTLPNPFDFLVVRETKVQ
jgi:hypothetical protein